MPFFADRSHEMPYLVSFLLHRYHAVPKTKNAQYATAADAVKCTSRFRYHSVPLLLLRASNDSTPLSL
jgi:hypothetical protein